MYYFSHLTGLTPLATTARYVWADNVISIQYSSIVRHWQAPPVWP